MALVQVGSFLPEGHQHHQRPQACSKYNLNADFVLKVY
jgi:hypothetical protein